MCSRTGSISWQKKNFQDLKSLKSNPIRHDLKLNDVFSIAVYNWSLKSSK